MASAQEKALSGKVALVTGASRGLGAAMAKRLAADGAKVVVNFARSEEAAHAVVAEVRAAGGEAVAIQADLARHAEVGPLFKRTTETFGGLDILVNNAGVYVPCRIDDLDMALYHRVFDLNVAAVFAASAEAARHFKTRPNQGGRIINLSSIAASGGTLGASLYAASKAAVEAMTRVHAAELGPLGVTVNAVAPGPVLTDMLRDGLPADFIQASIPQTPLRRLGEPEDIADVIAWLASDQSRWVTGEVIRAAGGLRR